MDTSDLHLSVLISKCIGSRQSKVNQCYWPFLSVPSKSKKWMWNIVLRRMFSFIWLFLPSTFAVMEILCCCWSSYSFHCHFHFCILVLKVCIKSRGINSYPHPKDMTSKWKYFAIFIIKNSLFFCSPLLAKQFGIEL